MRLTYTAVDTMAITKRGTRANDRCTVMKLVHTVYMLGAHALGAVKLSSTSRNLPNPPVGASTAATKPPTSFPSPSPAPHAGTDDIAAAANAAPSMCAGSCGAQPTPPFVSLRDAMEGAVANVR